MKKTLSTVTVALMKRSYRKNLMKWDDPKHVRRVKKEGALTKLKTPCEKESGSYHLNFSSFEV